MSNIDLLKSETTTLSEHVLSEDTKKSDNENRSAIVISSAPDTTTQTTITCNLSPCFSAFNVAVVGTVGAEIGDYVQLHNGLPHSSYSICNIVMEQPIASPTDNKIFVYNSDVVTDEVTANPQPQQGIKNEKINSGSCPDQKPAGVKVVTDCKKSNNVHTSILHLPNSAVREDTKSHRQWQPQLTPHPLTSSILHLPNNTVREETKSHKPWPQLVPQPLTSKPTDNMTRVGSNLDQGKSEQQITPNYMERQFKCEHKGCEKSFAYQTHLRFHVQHAHTGYSPYICDFEGCGRCFYTEHHLVVHLRTHTEVKPFVCPYEKCKKAFGTTGNLRNHIRTHTGEKPYKCSHKGCNKGFAELSSVKKHELTHTGEKPHPCRICGRCFSQAGSRNTHERLKHKDVFMSCDVKT